MAMSNTSKGMTIGNVSATDSAIQHVGDVIRIQQNYYSRVYLIPMLLTYHLVAFGLNFTLTYSSATHFTSEYSHPNQAILNWFSPLNFWVRQKDVFDKRQPRTGEWFLQNERFQRWFEGSEKALWCPGIRMTIRLNHSLYRILTSYQRVLERLSYGIFYHPLFCYCLVRLIYI